MGQNITKEDILERIQVIMEETFDISPSKVTLTAKLSEDLDVDSIDAVDLVVNLQNYSKKRFKPEDFSTVRTVGDIVDIVYNNIDTTAS